MKTLLSCLLAVALTCFSAGASGTYSLNSPDGRLLVNVNAVGHLSWSLSCAGETLVEDSPMSLTLGDGTVLGTGLKSARVIRRSVDINVPAAVYKKSFVRDNFNEMTLDFRTFRVVFRAYDSGAAYRFVVKSGKPFKVLGEQADFTFPEDWKVLASYSNTQGDVTAQLINNFESEYEEMSVSQVDTGRIAFLPVLVTSPSGRRLCIAESGLMDYPGMFLRAGGDGRTLSGYFAGYPKTLAVGGKRGHHEIVTERYPHIAEYSAGEIALPWRTAVVSENDKELLDNDLVWLLGDAPSVDIDFSWVRPGKVAWEWWNAWNIKGVDFESGVNDATYKYYIDFAASKGIEYVILDEGWSVPGARDLMQVVPSIHLEELVRYAGERNVGIILWAGYTSFSRDVEAVCRHYSGMGVKGFKVDFMERDDQKMVAFQARAAEIAAKYHLMLDFHGTFKPAGIQRTWPNVVNFEAVFGLEQMKWKEEADMVKYDVTIPFVRQLAGPMDYTQGAMRNATAKNWKPIYSEPMSQGTRCRQLAEYVIFESPLNMLCDSPSAYLSEPECTDFIAAVPTVWDETMALDGKVGEYVAMARRKGDVWYVGAITDWSPREMRLELPFVKGSGWRMEIFRDGTNAAKIASDYKRETVPFTSSIDVRMAPGGGFAARIYRDDDQMLAAQTYPDWLDSAAIYHIYPSSFQDSNGDGYGDLEGIRRRLDYVRQTGFNTIWLSPVFCSEFGDGGYDITDFYRIDPRFGTNADLVKLVEEAHEKGIKVCLDLVAGHTSDKHPWFVESAGGDRNGHYSDYYIWTDGKEITPPQPDRGGWVDNDYPRNGYYLMNYYDIQPALNYGYLSPDPAHSWEQSYDDPGPTAVRQELKNIIAFWFDKGVDGFRCDLAWSLVKGDDEEFHGVRKLWNEIFTWQSEHYPDRIFLSEWSSPIESISCGFDIDIIRHNGCGKTMYRDLVHNTYRNAGEDGTYKPKDCWMDKAGKGRFDTFAIPFTKMYKATRGHGFPCMPTSSHDTWRLNRNQRSTPEELRTAMTFFLTMPWVPIVYYGEEIGMRSMDGAPYVEGSRDRSAQRTPMQWDSSGNAGFSTCSPDKLYLPIDPSPERPTVEKEVGDAASLYNWTRSLLALRASVPALGNRGEWRMLTDPKKPYPVVYERFAAGERYIVVLNPSGNEVAADIEIEGKPEVVFGDAESVRFSRIAGGLRVRIKGTSSVVCRVVG
ncbi:MAG: glycoside hydrolase family 97 catalytic domain-containing protein [Candidatus Cryptobacteroides sp.]